ncbi:hypothetical protein [Coleofasciculus sp. F4-SAH-05]|uniref:hypothetical protein n=1 Tax=Coleofasciculus sp. F4-SAH-05 TaxID=3069525 RepID=UPI004062FB82
MYKTRPDQCAGADFSRGVWKSAKIGAGLVTYGCNRKGSSETRPYTLNSHPSPPSPHLPASSASQTPLLTVV